MFRFCMSSAEQNSDNSEKLTKEELNHERRFKKHRKIVRDAARKDKRGAYARTT